MTDSAPGERWLVRPGTKFKLTAVDPGATPGAPGDKSTTATAVDKLQAELSDLQERLYAEASRSLLVVVQALDAGGKDGTIRHVFTGVNPQGTRVTSFKAPTPEELGHDFLWRVHRAVPAAGEIGVFNRSHYEDVLVVRVHGLVPKPVWKARYDQINAFERDLIGGGTAIVKLWLHVSPEEQKRRFRERLSDPRKRWKFREGDLEERAHWRAYQDAAQDMLNRTSTEAAAWHVVPADHNWYRNWVVSRILVDTLAAMHPRYPEPAVDAERPIPDV